MKRFLPVIMLIGLIGLLATGCVVGTGPLVEKNYDLTGFNEIEISHDFEYDISRADTFRVDASIHQNLTDRLDITRSGQTLIVRLTDGALANSGAKVTITLPELVRLDISGASRGNVTGFKSVNNFALHLSGASQSNINVEAGPTKIDISGASRVNGSLKAAEMHLTVTGASHCDLNGSTAPAVIIVSGASTANMPDLVMQSAGIEASGASTVTINTSGKLDLTVSGASTLNYYGNPQMGKMDISGASKIHNK
jgi:hypothetical protein